MKEEIKKKIEEEAIKRFSEQIVIECAMTGARLKIDNIQQDSFKEGAEFIHSLAQQSVNSELLEALKHIESLCDNQNETHEAIWRIAHAAIQSQNKQNEKDSDTISLSEWESQAKTTYEILKQTETVSDAIEFNRFTLSVEGRDLMNEGKSMEMIYEIFKQSKTNPPKEK
jgi:hypothetical protein